MVSEDLRGPLLARGRTAELYAWQDGQVVKLFFDWCSEGAINREVEANRALSVANLPIPRLLGTVEIDGRRGIIFERVDGPSTLKLIGARPWLVVKMGRLLAELHVQVHGHRVAGLPAVREELARTIAHVDLLTAAEKEGALARLERLPDGESLCHYDFHPDQVLVTGKGPMIIDWMTAFRGQPAADVARTYVILSMAKAPFRNRAQLALLRLVQGIYRESYLKRYLALNPAVSHAQIRSWMLPVAAGRLREGIKNEEAQLLAFIRAELAQEEQLV